MQPIESGFAQMGARVKVREIPSRWTQGDADHATITLPFWHRVLMNTETQSRTTRFVAFVD